MVILDLFTVFTVFVDISLEILVSAERMYISSYHPKPIAERMHLQKCA